MMNMLVDDKLFLEYYKEKFLSFLREETEERTKKFWCCINILECGKTLNLVNEETYKQLKNEIISFY